MQYLVQSNLKRNGTLYQAGQTIELDEVEATSLVASGVVKLPEQPAAPTEPKADGFPDHRLDPQPEDQPAPAAAAPAAAQSPAHEAPAAPEAPAPSAPLEPSSSEQPSSPAPEPPSPAVSSAETTTETTQATAQPTPEQIAQDVAGL